VLPALSIEVASSSIYQPIHFRLEPVRNLDMASTVPLLRRPPQNLRRLDKHGSGPISESDSNMSLLQFLTQSGTVSSEMPMDDEGLLEHRLLNLQWRTGSAKGAKGEVTDIEKPKPRDRHSQSSRSMSCPPLDDCEYDGERKLWLLRPEMESGLLSTYPQLWKQLQSQVGLMLQCTLLLLVVCTYSACPLMVSWAKVVGTDDKGMPIKGRPFKESSVIFVSWGLIAIIGLALSWFLDGRKAVRQCFNRRSILIFAPAGIGWALADVCEVLAVSRLDPATYGVISQARLLGSATMCWILCGMKQTRLQWGILATLSVVCMAYCLVPDEEVTNTERLYLWRLGRAELHIGTPSPASGNAEPINNNVQVAGVLFALSKIALSVMSGVYAESQFKNAAGGNNEPSGLHVQMVQVSFSSMICAFFGYCVMCVYQGENLTEFFSGPDGSWDARTWAVAAVYCWREWICNLCVKHFDSLVKNICNAVALVVTYGFTVIATKEKPFSLLKVMLLLAVIAEVMNYCATKKKPSESTVSESTVSSISEPASTPASTPCSIKKSWNWDAPTAAGNLSQLAACVNLRAPPAHAGKSMTPTSRGKDNLKIDIPVLEYKVDTRVVDPDAHPAAARVVDTDANPAAPQPTKRF